jgi:hypothetical protein
MCDGNPQSITKLVGSNARNWDKAASLLMAEKDEFNLNV